MSDGMFSRHATMNAGAIPASAEELSIRFNKLLPQYSRLKAQHAVLKKAVIKEQASNIALQGNVKEKEKEIRKLQEQLDLLAFHNERLTKRIQAVQDSDQKGTHFSILGGSVKKELEKSAQALEEANLDLERKMQENERLHEELTDSKFEFTDSINSLLKQIQDLEKRVQELSDENVTILSETKTKAVHLDQTQLLKEIDFLKVELKEKSDLLQGKERQIQENNNHILSEIQSLRSILLFKVGDLKSTTSLYDLVPEASKALKELEEQAKLYFSGEQANIKDLSFEIAEKLNISTQTYSQQLSELVKQLEETKKELDELLLEKANNQHIDISQLQKQFEEKNQEQEKLYQEMNSQQKKEYDEQLKQLDEKLKQNIEANKIFKETNKQYEEKVIQHNMLIQEKDILFDQNNQYKQEIKLFKEQNDRYKEQNDQYKKQNDHFKEQNDQYKQKIASQETEFDEKINEKIKEITNLLSTIETNKENELKNISDLQAINEKLEKENSKLQQEIEQQKIKLDQFENDTKQEDDQVFVYPKTPEELPKVEEDEEDEEVFVYRGMDAVETPSPTIGSTEKSKQYDEKDVLIREEKLKFYYEHQINNLTEKIQMTDSKSVRLASMYKVLKERLVIEEKERQSMAAEIEKLNKNIKDLKDEQETAESNYKKQMDAMTEFISSMQEGVEEQQQRNQHNSGRNNY